MFTDIHKERDRLNRLSSFVIGRCIDIHRELGPGLLESAYEECLAYELETAQMRFVRQSVCPLRYRGVSLDCGYRVDLVVENALIVELKAVGELSPLHEAQLLTYVRLQGASLGLLINFNVPVLRDGIRRIVAGAWFRDPPVGLGGGCIR